MSMHRLVALLTAMLAVVAPTAGAAQPATPSRVILMFIVKPPADEARRDVLSWIQTFKNNVRSLLADLQGRPGSTPAIKIVVSTEDVDDVVDADILKNSFGRQPSLQILSTVASYSAPSTRVDNDIYLGDLKGSMADPFIHISTEIQPAQYKQTREALAAVTLYAYAMAIAQTSSADQNRIPVCNILDTAYKYREGKFEADTQRRLANLFDAIHTELQVRECGGKQ